MGALRAEYRWAVAAIRDATVHDVDRIFELLTLRSRAAFGVSQVLRKDVETELREGSCEPWVAVEGRSVVGYARLAASQTLTLAAVDREVNDALLAHAEAAARRRGIGHVIVYAYKDD